MFVFDQKLERYVIKPKPNAPKEYRIYEMMILENKD